MLRLLVLSDRMIGGHSAYSKVTYQTCTRLVEMGHKVAHTPMGRANRMGKQVYKGVLINESGGDPFGEDVAIQDYTDFKADLLITNKEPWVFKNIHNWAVNFTPMAIIDHSPISPSIYTKLHRAFKIIAISRFGQRELKKQNFNSFYIPNGVDTEIYKPLDKAECKKAFYLDPDDFVVGIVAMNRARKMIPQMLKGYKRFRELNPDVKSTLMLWTNVQARASPEETSIGVADVGVFLLPEIANLDLGNCVTFPDWKDIQKLGGLPEWDPTGQCMVKLYNSLDANFLCSGGEGAELPYIEAAACGVSSAYTNYAAAPEYAGPTGQPIRAEDYVCIPTPGTRYYLADVDGMSEALTKIMNADPERLAKKARRFSLRYDWKNVIQKHWKPFLEDAEKELYPFIKGRG